MADAKELREMIGAIDQEIIELIATRMEIADELAKVKKMSAQEFWDSNVEKDIINRYKKLVEEIALSEEEAEQIAKLILKISRERQEHLFK